MRSYLGQASPSLARQLSTADEAHAVAFEAGDELISCREAESTPELRGHDETTAVTQPDRETQVGRLHDVGHI
jgi:hypothetical protein